MEARRPYLIGIAGGSGAGKTTILRELFRRLPEQSVALVSQDNYYKPIDQQLRDENGEVNFDLPTSIDREHFFSDVIKLVEGRSITRKEYTFNNPGKEPELIEVKPAPIVVTEGLFIFHYEEIRTMLDRKVYLHADEEVCLQRRIARDQHERGYPEKVVRYQWDNHVLPAYRNYLLPYKEQSDLVIDNTHRFEDQLEPLVAGLLNVLETRSV